MSVTLPSMDPVTLILAALAAGASKGLTDATAAAKAARTYQRLRAAVKKRFADDPKADASGRPRRPRYLREANEQARQERRRRH